MKHILARFYPLMTMKIFYLPSQVVMDFQFITWMELLENKLISHIDFAL